jgi:imidazoleglycerol phosphate synthase glutamine amidotransferase subunit HisH
MPEPVFMKLGMYIMAPEPIITVYFIHFSYKSVSVCVSHIVARQRFDKSFTAAITRAAIVGRIVFCAIGVVSRKVGDEFLSELLVLK